ncbi:MAG: hypothetical protein ACFB13_03685 [Kiloniellaceae bacterium]
MFNKRIASGRRVSSLALPLALVVAGSLGGTAAAAQAGTGLVDAVATQVAARSDVFAASAAGLKVLPMNMAGSCPRSYMLKVALGAQSPGTLSYQIEPLDGRVSQVFRARTEAQADGSFAARAAHEVDLVKSEEAEADLSRVVFSAPASTAPQDGAQGEPQEEPGFFERLFGTDQTAADEAAEGLRQQSFRVRVVAPNEVVSAFDGLSVTCTVEDIVEQRAVAADEDQRDGNDGGRDRGGRDDNGGRGSGRGSSGSGGGTPGAVD